MLIGIAVLAIFLLLFLVMKVRLHAFVALLLVSIITALLSGQDPSKVADSIQNGMGGTLGFIAVVVGLGAMFGKVMEVTGALDQIANSLIRKFGDNRANIAMTLVGFICAIPLFFDVAFVLLIGIAFAVVRRTDQKMIKIAIALLAGIATCQAYLIPAAGPILVASQLGADYGYMIIFAIVISIPAMVLAGPIFGSWISKRVDIKLPDFENIRESEYEGSVLPTLKLSLFLLLLPLLLIMLKTVVSLFVSQDTSFYKWLVFFGHPFTALIISCLCCFYFLGVRRGLSNDKIMAICSTAMQPVGIIILVTGAGGVFKQVLIDSGVGAALGNMLSGSGMPIVLSAFILTAAVRIIQGSATVSMLTASGLILPILQTMHLNGMQLAVVTLAIGGGSIVCSHVNDSGFWLASRYLRMTEKQTLQTWTVMETIVGCTGGIIALIISAFW